MATLDPRAILAGRTRRRASVGVILTIAVSSACLIVALSVIALTSPTFVVGLLLALLPLPLLLAGVLALDRLEPEPPDALVLAFVWGAGVSVLVAMVVNTAGLQLVTEPLLGVSAGQFVSATFGAPVVEETLKGAVLFGMLWFRRQEIDGPTDGIIYAAMVGLGFATVENVSYYAAAQASDLEATFIMRGVFTPLLHPLCTSLTGIGIAVAAQRPPGTGRLWPPLLGLLGAMMLHGLWNGAAAFGLGSLALAYGVGALVLAAVLLTIRRDRRRTVALIGRHLPAYAHVGIVDAADLRMLTTLRTRRSARTWARAAGGAGMARAMADYQQAATELALLHERAARGAIDPRDFERRRGSLAALMQVTRSAFRPAPGAPR
jgi:RsiW-degrading membrane proteinase PrsW (M82 family)